MEKTNTEQIKVRDESGDHRYFTIIPNYILNHSTATAQALYLQLKKLAGEGGKAYPGSRYLMKKLGISYPKLTKEIKYLLDKGWIEYAGEEDVETTGGKQKVKSYRIIDLWRLNSEFYSGGEKIATPKAQRGEKIATKGVKSSNERRTIEEEHITYTSNAAGVAVNEVINLFKPLNPSYERLFGNKTQRAAVESLLKKAGSAEKLKATIDFAAKVQGERYAPTITTPLQLEDKLGSLIAYYKKQQSQTPTLITL